MGDTAHKLARQVRAMRTVTRASVDRLCDAVLANDSPSVDAAQLHYEQALALLAEAEQGEAMYDVGTAEVVEIVDVPLTRHDKLLVANTHMLLALYLELRR